MPISASGDVMASEGPLYPGTEATDSSVGTVSWSNIGLGRLGSSNDVDIFRNITSGPTVTTRYAKATNFGFAIPADATIDGILVEVEKASQENSGTNFAVDNSVRLYKGGSLVGSDLADGATKWPTSDTFISYGASLSELWGTTWTPAEINNSGFGVGFSMLATWASGTWAAGLDCIRITVYYTPATTGQPSRKRMGGVAHAYGGYQPKVGIMRWRHQQSGLILPNRTIIQPELRLAS